MKLRNFFLLSFLAFGTVAAAAMGALVISAYFSADAARKIGSALSSVRAAEELQNALLIHNRESLLSGVAEERYRREHAGRVADAELELDVWESAIGGYADPEKERELVARVRAEIAEYLGHREAVKEMSPLDAYRSAAEFVDRAHRSIEDLVMMNIEQAFDVEERMREQGRLAVTIAVVVAVLLFAMTGTLVWGLRRFVYRPLLRLRQRIAGFAGGDGETGSGANMGASLREVREIGDVFSDMAETLVRQREMQLRFVAAVAHDLRNPLSAIRMSAELVNSPQLPEENRSEMLGAIRRQTKHLERALGDLLDTARIEAGELDLRREHHDLCALCREAGALHEGVSQSHRLHVEVPDEPLTCECDATRISQVLNNLLANAIKYSPHGGRVRLTASRAGPEAVISVTDEGMGIAADDLERIFEPFRRSPATRETIPGVGLGLSVSRRIVEAHGGRIEVESRPGEGSAFRVRLPLLAEG